MSKQIKVGNVLLGGGASISVQSMTTADTADAVATSAQINALAKAGCDIVRIAIPDRAAALAVKEIKRRTTVPLVADIHFNYKLALLCLDGGIDKIRINPGNIGGAVNVKIVADACSERNVPIRVGVNSGSLERDILAKHGGVTAAAMVESAVTHVRLLENANFSDICVSMKASDVSATVQAYRLFREQLDYPLHIGITAAGGGESAAVKAAAGLGSLLLDGIGDTMRVSLTGDPLNEPRVAIKILAAVGLRRPRSPELISCPTCGRCKVDLEQVITDVRSKLSERIQNGAAQKPGLKIAVMGCEVNGPGEAKEADFGVACGQRYGILFAHGETVRKISVNNAAEALSDLVFSE
jgi:(E)-4-hydroxy-3-methylbut-2-enyl-diphosphate synthase